MDICADLRLVRYIHTHLRYVRVTMWTLTRRTIGILYGLEDEAAAREFDRQLARMNAPCFLVVKEVTGRVRAL
jgi:hypothetical protein